MEMLLTSRASLAEILRAQARALRLPNPDEATDDLPARPRETRKTRRRSRQPQPVETTHDEIDNDQDA